MTNNNHDLIGTGIGLIGAACVSAFVTFTAPQLLFLYGVGTGLGYFVGSNATSWCGRRATYPARLNAKQEANVKSISQESYGRLLGPFPGQTWDSASGAMHVRRGPIVLFYGLDARIKEKGFSKVIHDILRGGLFPERSTEAEAKQFHAINHPERSFKCMVFQHILARSRNSDSDQVFDAFDYVNSTKKTDPAFYAKASASVFYTLEQTMRTKLKQPPQLDLGAAYANVLNLHPPFHTTGTIAFIRFTLTTEQIAELEKENIGGISVYTRGSTAIIPQPIPMKYASQIVVRSNYWNSNEVQKITDALAAAKLDTPVVCVKGE